MKRRIKSRIKFWVLLICASSLSSGLQAEIKSEQDTLSLIYGSEQMVSIATGTEQLLYKSPAIASIISRRDIQQSAARTLDEVLEMIPGLHISRDYAGTESVYTARGFFRAPDAGMLLMLNGVPVNSLRTGSRPAALQMPLNAISQIEIIRGPGSSVYGADAFVGVINIITLSPGEQTSYGLQYGNFAQQGGWMQENFQLAGWFGRVWGDYMAADGDSHRIVEQDMQSYLDNITGTDVSYAPDSIESAYQNYQVGFELQKGKWQWQQYLSARQSEGNGHGVPGLDVLDPEGNIESQLSQTQLIYADQQWLDNWSLQMTMSWLINNSSEHRQLLPDGSLAPLGDDGNLFTGGIHSVTFPAGMLSELEHREQQGRFEFSLVSQHSLLHRVRLNTGAQLQSYALSEARNYGPGVLDNGQSVATENITEVDSAAAVSLPDGDRQLRFLALQDEWNFAIDWSLTAGIRYDHYNDFGNSTNPRLALVWQADYDLTAKLLYGRAFRAPSYQELNLQNQLGYSGNPLLQPETIDTVEFAIDYRPVNGPHSKFSIFTYQADNLIIPVEDRQVSNSFQYENSARQQGYGIEAEVNWSISASVMLLGNYAWQYSYLDDTEEQSANAPTKQLYSRLVWQIKNFWSVSAEAHYIGQMPRVLGDSRNALPASVRFDTRLDYQNHYKNWAINLRLLNLFNEDIYEPSISNNSISGGAALAENVPMEGRAVLLEFRYYPGKINRGKIK